VFGWWNGIKILGLDSLIVTKLKKDFNQMQIFLNILLIFSQSIVKKSPFKPV
jgi:hypothetical protein